MDTRSPSIACIGIIGRSNQPLHISLFPATGLPSPAPNSRAERDKLEFSFMLNSCLDIFEARMPSKGLTHDFGLLHALDERIAMYGWQTNTGVKFVIVIDMEGAAAEGGRVTAGLGLRNSDLTPAFQALQTAYIRLLRNPFYVPDEHDPKRTKGHASLQITSPRFLKEVERIGLGWYPGITVV